MFFLVVVFVVVMSLLLFLIFFCSKSFTSSVRDRLLKHSTVREAMYLGITHVTLLPPLPLPTTTTPCRAEDDLFSFLVLLPPKNSSERSSGGSTTGNPLQRFYFCPIRRPITPCVVGQCFNKCFYGFLTYTTPHPHYHTHTGKCTCAQDN